MNALPTGRAGRLLALAILLLLLATLWTAAVQPLLGWYENRAEALRDVGALVARQAALAAALPKLERAARGAPTAAPAEHAFLDAATDAIAGAMLEQQLQTMTNQIGASLSSAETLAPQISGPYHRIELKVTVASDWPTFIRLLRNIATAQPTMLVDDLSVASATPVPGVPPIGASFTVIAFRDAAVNPAKDPSGPGSAMAP